MHEKLEPAVLLVYLGKKESMPALACDALSDHPFSFCAWERRLQAAIQGILRIYTYSRTECRETKWSIQSEPKMVHLYYGPWTNFHSQANPGPTLRSPRSKALLLRQSGLRKKCVLRHPPRRCTQTMGEEQTGFSVTDLSLTHFINLRVNVSCIKPYSWLHFITPAVMLSPRNPGDQTKGVCAQCTDRGCLISQGTQA